MSEVLNPADSDTTTANGGEVHGRGEANTRVDGDAHVPDVCAPMDSSPLRVIENLPFDQNAYDLIEEHKAANKATLSVQNEFLSRLVTLNTALIGGGLVLSKGDILGKWWSVGVISILLISLVTAVAGLAPASFTSKHPFPTVEAAEEFYEAKLRRSRQKELLSWAAAGLFLFAMLVGVVGMAAN
jgi:hypothetical protein